MECFNCLKQGHCDFTMRFKNEPSRKPLHFCVKSCMEDFQRKDAFPRLVVKNQKQLEFVCEVLIMMKEDQQLLLVKKPFAVEKMLRTSLAARKPKAECMKLYALWKESATEALDKIGDDKDLQESVLLKWAEVMKSHDKVFPFMIQTLSS